MRMPATKTLVLDNTQIGQKINRIAYQIYENNFEEEEIIIAGIVDKGYTLAERIAIVLKEIAPLKIRLVKVTINKKQPLSEPVQSELSASEIKNKVVIVVDDVLNSGITLAYGVKYFLDFPVKAIRTVVMVDRSHKIFPIKADYVGLTLATTLKEHISVELDNKGNDAVYLT